MAGAGAGAGSVWWEEVLEHREAMANEFLDPFSCLAEPPGPIDNSKIAVAKGSGHMQVKQGKLPLGIS